MATMDTTIPDFSTIPEHLLVSIGKFLHTRIDILRFRAVCRLFRSVLPLPPKLLFPPSILTATDFLRSPYAHHDRILVLTESTVYAIEPLNRETSQTWILKVQESEPGRVQIKDALYRIRLKDLGNLSTKLPKSLNLLDYRVKEIATSYVFNPPATLKRIFRDGMPLFCSKVIFTSGVDERDDGFAVMARFGARKLRVWRNIDKKWTDIDLGLGYIPYIIEDIIYHNNKFFVVVFRGRSMLVDSKSLTVTPVAAGPQGDYRNLLCVYLVESCKNLLLIAEYAGGRDNFQSYFKIFKLDEEKCEWVPVVGGLELDDRVLFVSRDRSFSVSAKEFPGCKGNCVYFRAYNGGHHGYPGKDAWIFDLKDGKARKLSDIPGYADLFWPPLSWLKQHSCSAGCSSDCS